MYAISMLGQGIFNSGEIDEAKCKITSLSSLSSFSTPAAWVISNADPSFREAIVCMSQGRRVREGTRGGVRGKARGGARGGDRRGAGGGGQMSGEEPGRCQGESQGRSQLFIILPNSL